MKRRFAAMMLSGIGLCASSQAIAQSETLLVQPSLPEDFDRGRNISVLQRARPDYDAIGIRLGSFNLQPQVGVDIGYSDNLYYSKTNKVDAPFIQVSPAFRLDSDWSRHSLKLRGSTQAQRYFSEPLRNQTPWDLGAVATLEFGGSTQIIPEVQIARQYENAFSGDTTITRSVLSNYLRKYASLRAEHTSGQAKFTAAVDDTDYEFSTIKLPTGGTINQDDRDRNLLRVTGQAQYAFTPSVSVYVQGNYTRTNYDRPLFSGVANRDSDSYRLIGGFNFDLAGLMRGTVGIGYTRREFDSPVYRTINGFSAEGKLEYFPSELTTVTAAVRRVLEDSSLANGGAYFENRARLQVDHEFRTNLIGTAYGELARQNFLDSPLNADIYRVGVLGTYLSSNWLSFNLGVIYTGRSVNQSALGQEFNEFRGQIGVVLKR